MSSEDGSGAFVAPSKLQEASLWSTAFEQAALERRMREASMPRTTRHVSEWRSIGLYDFPRSFVFKTRDLFKAVGLLV